jgi:hypothetical protein
MNSRRPDLTDTERSELMLRIADWLRVGKTQSVSAIAAQIGKSPAHVSKSLLRQGVAPRQKSRPVTIVGIGVVPQPQTTIRKLRKAFPDVQWTVARVLPIRDKE